MQPFIGVSPLADRVSKNAIGHKKASHTMVHIIKVVV